LTKIKLINFIDIKSSSFEEDVKDCWNFEKSVEQYKSIGGTAFTAVTEQIKRFKLKYLYNSN
jgi:argininosuccinate lyase